jgi:SPP1 family phage portal protein
MVLQKTSKTVLSSDDILNYITDYESKQVPHLNDLWEYYKGKNVKISSRKSPDSNNPDNKIIVSYARKIINTFTGYAYRPKYISYKPNVKTDNDENKEIPTDENIPLSTEETFTNELKKLFDLNNEHVKTNRAGRNTGIFGLSYEIMYIDSDTVDGSIKAVPKFFTVDPRELIALYNFEPEPDIIMAIRYYMMDDPTKYKVDVYYEDHIEHYIRQKKDVNSTKWLLLPDAIPTEVNLFGEVPVIAYYMGDEIQSIFENVITLIDAYDVLMSDSMNEFDRFAFAYLIMKRISLTNPIDKKDPVKSNNALKEIKRRRIFEGLDKDADIKFLTKDIPTAFIDSIGTKLREQIHIQSHVPDFSGDRMAGASGIAIQRLMFDFENLVSSAEADFDIALNRRIDLICRVLSILGKDGGHEMVTIQHKRNMPVNNKEFADTAFTMMQAGFSRRAIVGIMPEDIIPDIEKELEYEKEEQSLMTGGDLYSNNDGLDVNNEPVTIDPDKQKQIDALVQGGMDLSTAKAKVLSSDGPQQFSDTTGKLSNG